MSLQDVDRVQQPAHAADVFQTAAALIDSPGASPRIGSVTLPARSAGTSVISVLAAALNPLDLLIAFGNFHSARHDSAYVPGSECVGVVLQSDTFEVGTRVYAESHASPASPGTFAERTLVRDEDVLPLPVGVDPVAAAAVGNSGVAAFLPLVEMAGLSRGESVVVLGATGAVGQLAVQIAKLHGAGQIVGVGRDHAALQRLLALGADAVVDLRAGEDESALVARLSDATAGSANVVLDCLYGPPLQAALQVCSPGARVINVGNLAGPTALIPAGLLRGRQIRLSGFAGLHTALQDKRQALTWLWSALTTGDLRIDARTVSLIELPEAWSAQAASPHTKIVIRPLGMQQHPLRDPYQGRS